MKKTSREPGNPLENLHKTRRGEPGDRPGFVAEDCVNMQKMHKMAAKRFGDRKVRILTHSAEDGIIDRSKSFTYV